MRALGWHVWLLGFYLLSSSAFAGDLSMATKVSLAGLPNEPKLLINLKNEGPRAIAFLSSNSKCNTAGPDGLRCCHAKEILSTHECGRP